MQGELADALLDILWEWHLAGGTLPNDLTAEIGPRGPEIRLRMEGQTYRWRRGDGAEQGKLWELSPLLH